MAIITKEECSIEIETMFNRNNRTKLKRSIRKEFQIYNSTKLLNFIYRTSKNKFTQSFLLSIKSNFFSFSNSSSKSSFNNLDSPTTSSISEFSGVVSSWIVFSTFFIFKSKYMKKINNSCLSFTLLLWGREERKKKKNSKEKTKKKRTKRKKNKKRKRKTEQKRKIQKKSWKVKKTWSKKIQKIKKN